MSKWRISWALGLAVLIFGLARAQEPQSGGKDKKDSEAPVRDAAQKALQEWITQKPKEGTLEDLLARAVKDNPDIRVAEAKLREADAELSRVRQQVMQKIVAAHGQIGVQKLVVEDAVAKLRRGEKLLANKAISAEEYREGLLAVQKAKAELATLEAQLPYLTGKQPLGRGLDIFAPDGRLLIENLEHFRADKGSAAPKSQKIKEEMAEKIRTAMQAPVKGSYTDVTARELLDLLTDGGKNINIQVSVKNPEVTATLKLTSPVPLGAALQWIEDQFSWRFVVRDYGIVAVERDSVPPEAVLLQDLLKAPPKEGKK